MRLVPFHSFSVGLSAEYVTARPIIDPVYYSRNWRTGIEMSRCRAVSLEVRYGTINGHSIT